MPKAKQRAGAKSANNRIRELDFPTSKVSGKSEAIVGLNDPPPRQEQPSSTGCNWRCVCATKPLPPPQVRLAPHREKCCCLSERGRRGAARESSLLLLLGEASVPPVSAPAHCSNPLPLPPSSSMQSTTRSHARRVTFISRERGGGGCCASSPAPPWQQARPLP